MSDAVSGVEEILAQWARERPDLDVSPMAVIGRLTRAASIVEAELADTFAANGLDAASFDVLATLLRSGAPHELSPKALSASAMVTSSAIAQRVNKLEDAGLVVRRRSETDGRGTVVALAEAGRRLVEQALPDHLATERRLLADLSPADQTVLAELLSRIGSPRGVAYG
ncbi:MarR family winged helix-turn-helix transcriptional regulator [Plantibacter sp. Mn2098]|uniref:MarR family winged helix-turn-helix transcriptional regulator n=1 Tax=Plantibacter sp. Mn2098 TaxID=3395266 RepID=UPI003BD052EB